MTSGDTPSYFFLHDNGQEADECVIIFATDNQLEQMAQYDDDVLMGHLVLHHACSVSCEIQGRVNGVFLPLVYVLLKRIQKLL